MSNNFRSIAAVAGMSFLLVGCATAPTVEQVNSANAAREGSCEQQGYKRGSKDFYTCLQLASNKRAADSAMGTVGTSMAVGAAAMLLMLLLSDERVKRDITAVGHRNGFTLYRFHYAWSDRMYVGVLAQEVRAVFPKAVVEGSDGYLRVNYARLGLRMITLAEWEERGMPSMPAQAHPFKHEPLGR